MSDSELLQQHREGSTEAFAELVRRHLGWVYGIARRRLRDSHLAEDVAQAVFVLLHRKGPAFAADGAMIGWLHTVTWRAAEVAARNQSRRQQRETSAAALNAQEVSPADSTDIPWHDLAQMLDELVGRLSRADAEAVLLRYYREMSFAEVAAELKITPEAARKRVGRAIEKLRRIAAEKGIDMTSTSLAANIGSHLIFKTPPGLTATTTVAATAPAGSAMSLSSSAIVKGIFVMTNKTKITAICVAACLLIAGGVAFLVAQDDPVQNIAAAPSTVPVEQVARPVPAAPTSAPRVPRNAVIRGILTNVIGGADLAMNATDSLGIVNHFIISTDLNSRFEIDGRDGSIRDLSPGMSVTIMTPRTGVPMTVLAASSGYMATVERIEGTNLVVLDAASEERTVVTDEMTRINFLIAATRGAGNVVEQPGLGKLQDIHPGSRVTISPDSGVAKAIQVAPPGIVR